jgi:hypothetical protein
LQPQSEKFDHVGSWSIQIAHNPQICTKSSKREFKLFTCWSLDVGDAEGIDGGLVGQIREVALHTTGHEDLDCPRKI